MVRHEGGHSEGEQQEPKNEIRIGGGDNIKINSLIEGKEKLVNNLSTTEEVQLLDSELEEILGDLSNLPFHVGDPEGTIRFDSGGQLPDAMRPTHEVEINISPFVYNAPAGEETYLLAIDFKDSKVWGSSISPHSVKELNISQPMYESAQNWRPGPERESIKVNISFAPEGELIIRGKKIERIALLIKR